MGTQRKRAELGYTIIEVMLFFGVTGALMVGILGSATLGVNSQRYSDAVNTFASIVQQEFTNATNVVNTQSVQSLCGSGPDTEIQRGLSDCVIIGRLMTINSDGDMVRSNLIGKIDSGATADTSANELELAISYDPTIDTTSQEKGQMNWGTRIEKAGTGSNVSFLIIRSPRTGNLYSYVLHSSSEVIASKGQLLAALDDLRTLPQPKNASDQYMCVDRSGWVLSPGRAVKLAAYTSGPSGVSTVESAGTICN